MRKEKHIVQTLIREILNEGKEVEVPVFGLSMFPFLLPGTTIRVIKVCFTDIKRGDVIFFERNGQLVLHRVLVKKSDYIQCKGDSLIKKDQMLGADNFFAKMVGFRINKKWFDCQSKRYKLFRFFMLHCHLFLGYVLNPLSFVWYHFYGDKVDIS